jgi:regulator of protease activity HflC (stomatin/prohibitin superfamily)
MGIFIVGLIALIVGVLGSRPDGPFHRFKRIIIAISIILMLVGILTASIRQINAGRVGVQVLFGEVLQDKVLHEGLTLVNPLVDVKEMTVQTQNYTMSGVSDEGQKSGDDAIRVLSKDGLEVVIDMTILYRVISSECPKIYQKIGLDYQDKVVRPITRTTIRESASYFDAVALFSLKREEFEHMIRTKIDDEFKSRGLILEQIMVRNIALPKSVKESIERKITAVQDAQRMEFVLQKEKQEAERKRVEAQGVADAQKIVNSGLSDKILQFEMIKVQKELVTSPNSKIIVMGNSKGGVPFILGGEK